MKTILLLTLVIQIPYRDHLVSRHGKRSRDAAWIGDQLCRHLTCVTLLASHKPDDRMQETERNERCQDGEEGGDERDSSRLEKRRQSTPDESMSARSAALD